MYLFAKQTLPNWIENKKSTHFEGAGIVYVSSETI